MESQFITTMIDIMVPVLEQAMILAAEYSKACGRDTVLPEDVKYAMKYCARYSVGQRIGTMFPEDDDSDEEEEDIVEVDPEECPPFTRYTGDDPRFIQVNEAVDTWESWVPQSPAEEMLKNTIDSNEHFWTRSVVVLRNEV